jgi:hypothetical protein
MAASRGFEGDGRYWMADEPDPRRTDGDDFLVDVELLRGWESHRVLIKEIH